MPAGHLLHGFLCFWLLSACYSALCSLSNVHPLSGGAYMKLSSTSHPTTFATITSPVASYGQTVYFDCSPSYSVALRIFHSSNDQTIALGKGSWSYYVAGRIFCQATNMFTLEPFSFSSTRYELDLNRGWYNVPSDACRIILLNTGYSGTTYWEHRATAESEWVGFSDYWNTATKFGVSRIYYDVVISDDIDTVTSIQWRVKQASGAVIATSEMTSLTQFDRQLQIHVNLIGSGNSFTPHILQTVRSCLQETPQLQCNSCPSNSPTWVPSFQPTFPPTNISQFSISPTLSPIPTRHPTLRPTWPPTVQPTTKPSRQPSERPTTQPTYSAAPSEAPTGVPGASTIQQTVVFAGVSEEYAGELKSVCEAGYGKSLGICTVKGTFLAGCSVDSVAVVTRRAQDLAVTFTSSVSSENADNAVRMTQSLDSEILTQNTQAAAEAMDKAVTVPTIDSVQLARVATPAPSAPEEEGGGDGDFKISTTVIIVVSGGALLLCVGVCWCCRCRPEWKTLEEEHNEQQEWESTENGNAGAHTGGSAPPTYRNNRTVAPPTYIESYIRGDASANPVPAYNGPPTYREYGPPTYRQHNESAVEVQPESVVMGLSMLPPDFEAPVYESGYEVDQGDGVEMLDVGIPMAPTFSANPIALGAEELERSIDQVVGVPDAAWLADIDLGKRE